MRARSPSRTSTRPRSACSRRRATTAARSRSARARRPATTELRRSALRLPRGPHRVHPAHARADRRRDGGRRGRARLCAHAADPGAAHPAREGDVEHDDQPDAAGARRARLPLAGSGRRGCASWGRPAWASPRTRRSGSERLARVSDQPTFKEFAVRVGRPAREVDRARRASEASTRATRSDATTRGWTTRCSSRVTEKRTPRTIDGSREVLAEVAADEAHLRALAPGPAAPARCRATDLPRAEVPERRFAGADAAAPARGLRARARPPLHGARRPQLRDRHRLLPARLAAR